MGEVSTNYVYSPPGAFRYTDVDGTNVDQYVTYTPNAMGCACVYN